jgi:hypothetical protein
LPDNRFNMLATHVEDTTNIPEVSVSMGLMTGGIGAR